MWQDGAFQYVRNDDGTEDKTRVRCCQCKLAMAKHSETSNLIYHMERKHNEFWTNLTDKNNNNQPKVN